MCVLRVQAAHDNALATSLTAACIQPGLRYTIAANRCQKLRNFGSPTRFENRPACKGTIVKAFWSELRVLRDYFCSLDDDFYALLKDDATPALLAESFCVEWSLFETALTTLQSCGQKKRRLHLVDRSLVEITDSGLARFCLERYCRFLEFVKRLGKAALDDVEQTAFDQLLFAQCLPHLFKSLETRATFVDKTLKELHKHYKSTYRDYVGRMDTLLNVIGQFLIMPPKRDARKDQVGDGGNGPGSRTVDVVMPQNAGNGGSGIAGTGFGPALDGNGGAVPPNPGAAPAPGDHSSASSSSAGGAPPMEVDLTQESIKDKLTQATQEVLARAKGVDAQSAKEISASWGKVRKQMQPKLNLCLLEVVESVPDEFEPEQAKETAHPGVRPVAFRDLVENARADIVESLEELVKWVVTNAQDPATLQSLAGLKQEAHTQVYDTVLSKMSRDILDRMADIGSSQVDFGRDSDYGQALQAQQNLAKEKDDLQLQLEGFQKQVDDLKASEADLYAKCTELQEKFANAQADLWVSKDKVDILDAVTKFLGTDDANVDDARIKDLETQLRAAKDANVNLQRIVADQQKQITSGSGGAQQSLVERAREIGFIIDPSGNLQLGPPPRQSLRHLTALLLHQQVRTVIRLLSGKC
ncbi:hypothetical protein AAVH_20467 [Aphelenchoides avenae]|nr:hypothetical protein AAVH_20467 [Aphelenchus avenae]